MHNLYVMLLMQNKKKITFVIQGEELYSFIKQGTAVDLCWGYGGKNCLEKIKIFWHLHLFWISIKLKYLIFS